MAWRFSKRIKIIPGVHLNIGKNGISTTIGVRGASVNFGKNGTYLNAGIPGTGLSTRQKIGTQRSPVNHPVELPVEYGKAERKTASCRASDDNIFSADVEEITSQNMQGIKEAILSAHKQRLELLNDLKMVQLQLRKNKSKLLLSYWLFYGFVFKEWTKKLKNDIHSQTTTIGEIEQQAGNSVVELDVDFDEEMSLQYKKMYAAFEKLCQCNKMWDITSEYTVDRFTTRSAASSTVMRKTVQFRTGQLPEIKSDIKAMIWDNANGADLYFYPNFMVVWNDRKHFAVVAYNELDINFMGTRFIETEKVPLDSVIIDQTWMKVNKNGSPDKRFKDNYQIPVVRYGDIELKTQTGLNERYLFSSYKWAEEFNRAFLEYQIELVKLDYVAALMD